MRRGLLERAEDRLPAEAGILPHPVYGQHGLLRAYALALIRRAAEENIPATRYVEYFQELPGTDWRAAELFWEQIAGAWQRAWDAGTEQALAFYYSCRGFLVLRARHHTQIAWVSALLGLRDKRAVSVPDRAVLLNNVGWVYDALGDKAKALEYYEQALPLRRQVGDRAGEATTLNNMGGVYDALGDKAKALEYYEQALPLQRQVGDRWGESVTRFNIAMVYEDWGRLEQAEEQLQQVIALDEAIGHPDLASDRAALARVRERRVVNRR